MRTLRIPPPLSKNDRIAVIAPASPPDKEALQKGVRMLAKRYSVDVSAEVETRSGYLAGEDAVRAAALQRALDDNTVRAIIAARGGFGPSRILDRIDFRKLLDAPKWIVGSSDLTVLSTYVYASFGLATIHGPMAASLGRIEETDGRALFDLLEGKSPDTEIPLSPLVFGRAESPLVGGNLTMLAHMIGTLPTDFAKDAILFLEDVGEKPYRLDRCLTQLRRAGIANCLAGIVFGEFTDCVPNGDGVTAEDVAREFAAQANIPAALGYPAAHGKRNAPFIQGATAVLKVSDTEATLSFSS